MLQRSLLLKILLTFCLCIITTIALYIGLSFLSAKKSISPEVSRTSKNWQDIAQQNFCNKYSEKPLNSKRCEEFLSESISIKTEPLNINSISRTEITHLIPQALCKNLSEPIAEVPKVLKFLSDDKERSNERIKAHTKAHTKACTKTN